MQANSNVVHLPPSNIDAEMSVLGSILGHPQTLEIVSTILRPEDFYVPAHQEIYSAMLRCSAKGMPADIYFVGEELGDKFKKVGGKNKLNEFLYNTDGAIAPHGVNNLAELVKQKSTLRSLISIANNAVNSAMQLGANPKDVVEAMQGQLMRLQVSQPNYIRSFADILVETFAEIEALNNGEESISDTIPTGFYDLDALIGGFRIGCLTVIGGRGGLGKTTFAIEVALNAASNGIPTAFFALEMTSSQAARKALARLAAPHINSEQLFRKNGIAQVHWEPLHEAMAKGAGMPLMIQDAPGLTLSGLRADLRRVQAVHGDVGLAIIDYTQLLTLDGSRNPQNRVIEIDMILKELRAIAKDFNCAVVGLAQLSRAVESRQDKRPMKSDFRESGAFEQEAAVMLGLYRDDYYNQDSPDRGIAEVSVLKNRFGQEGVVKLLFDHTCGQFKNLARRGY